jgi:uncharacterized protein YndB with AHSA1/START domain
MPDILHDFPIKASVARVFAAVSMPDGLDHWWTLQSAGSPAAGNEYQLNFGPKYDWRATVTRCVPDSEFELQIGQSDKDWNGTRVGFRLEARASTTWVHFYHTGWPSENEHYRISNCCWAMYLRILRRYLEHGEVVPYDNRLDV